MSILGSLITFLSSELTVKHLSILKNKFILKVEKKKKKKNGTTSMYLKGQIFSYLKILFIYNSKINMLIIKLTCWL